MSGYLSSLLTTTTSRYASLRSLIPSNSENDGDTEDDTHICRVLRGYYTEKGRSFPGWLPPDPKAAQVPVVQPYAQNSYGQPVGAGYGGIANGGAAGQSKLGSLWDPQPAGGTATPQQSLRQGGRGATAASVRAGARSQSSRDPYNRSQTQQSLEPPVQARPLPSQRAGSYQTAPQGAPTATSGAGGTAQDRLKARLWGAPRTAAQDNVPASEPSPSRGGYDRGNNYSSQNNYSAAGGGGSYGDSYTSSSNVVPSRDNGRSEKPFVAATAPWASNEDEFSGQGYGGAYNPPAPRTGGLPSMPAAGRRGSPSGPRGMR